MSQWYRGKIKQAVKSHGVSPTKCTGYYSSSRGQPVRYAVANAYLHQLFTSALLTKSLSDTENWKVSEKSNQNHGNRHEDEKQLLKHFYVGFQGRRGSALKDGM